ncbi:MAG: hypothetical protein Q4G46_09765 [Propionibacteriaceae bacterium]|nr:hypothetical protein [Propionibacteriaceae bacterium]
MTTLLVPELQRYLTRRVTWITGLVAASLFGVIALFAGAQSSGPRVRLSDFGPSMIVLAVMLVSAWSFFTAASAIGSEQSSGALGTWLTFNPRRWPVFTAKLLSVTLPAAVAGLAALLVAFGWSLLISSYSPPSAVVGMFGMVIRGTLVVVSIAALGFVLAVITRSTLGALGVLVGWLVLFVFQVAITSMMGAYSQWIGLERALAEFLLNQEYVRYGEIHSNPWVVGGAGLIWFAFVAAVVIFAGWLFARRDVD